jgi:cell division septation protein DedD
MVTDPSGKGVYLIPECIAEKTVSTTMSLPAPEPARTGGAFAVQVGAFAQPKNAERMERLLRQDGFAVRTWSALFRRKTLPVTVVSAVAFGTRAEADAAREKISASYGVEALVVPNEVANLALQ